MISDLVVKMVRDKRRRIKRGSGMVKLSEIRGYKKGKYIEKARMDVPKIYR